MERTNSILKIKQYEHIYPLLMLFNQMYFPRLPLKALPSPAILKPVKDHPYTTFFGVLG